MIVCGRGSNGGTSHLTSAEKRSRRASIKKRPGSPDRNKDPQTVTAADGESNNQPPERSGKDTDPLLERGAETSRDYEEERERGERETKDDSEE